MRTNSSPAIRFSSPSLHTWTAILSSSAHTHSLGNVIGHHLQGGEVILLTGDLGAGKTTLIRGIAEGCGIPPDHVSSPTFTIIQEYQGTQHLIHADLYRLEHPEEILSLGLSEIFDHDRVVLIEWADRLPLEQLPPDRLMIHLTHRSRHSRGISLSTTGEGSSQLCLRTIQHHPVPAEDPGNQGQRPAHE